MPSVEITATYLGERFRFDNADGAVVIGSASLIDSNESVPNIQDGRFSVKGPIGDEDFELNGAYRFYGRWTKYTNKRSGKTEIQFAFTTVVQTQPLDRAGVISYLRQAGKGHGVGTAKARQLWDKFGNQCVKVCRKDPEAVAAAVKIKVEEAKLISEWLEERADIEQCSIEVMSLFESRGLPKATVRKAIAKWGGNTANVLKGNPYLLLLHRFHGCGFKLTDKMYLDLGHDPARLKRQALCAWHSIASNTAGHTWYQIEVAKSGVTQNVPRAQVQPIKAIKMAKRAKLLSTIRSEPDGDKLNVEGKRVWIAEARKARNEVAVAESVANALREPSSWPSAEAVLDCQELLTDHQLDNYRTAAQGMICSLGGSPGTGKTFLGAAVIKAIVREQGRAQVAVAAPTGKAAVRISECMEQYGVGLRARTIHSHLGVEQADSGAGWSFSHGRGNPLPYRYIVVDETSMVGTDLFSHLLAARGPNTHIICIGDINQLSPVEHGAPLRDMIRAGVPHGQLTEIQRNSGKIIEACAEMREKGSFNAPTGKLSKLDVNVDDGRNLFFIDASPEEQVEVILQSLDRVRDMGFDPISECQVVVPVNQKSPVSRSALNKVLQAHLNLNEQVKGSPFRVGDKIVNTKNGYFPITDDPTVDMDDEDIVTNDRGEVYVANGELARVVESSSKLIIAKLESPTRVIKIPRGIQGSDGDGNSDQSATGCSWDLGFALSVHKSQGSEWPVVIPVIDEYPGAKMVCDRSWVYTAFSRGKLLVLPIGQLATAQRFCRKNSIDDRKTFLRQLIHREQAQHLLAEI